MELVKERKLQIEHASDVRKSRPGGDCHAVGGDGRAGREPDAAHATAPDVKTRHAITDERHPGAECALEHPAA